MLAAGVAHTSVEADDSLLRAMAASLSYGTTRDVWKLGRVGLVGPEPVFSPDKSICGLVVGQIFDDSEQSLRDLLAAPSNQVKGLARELNGSFCIVLADLKSGGVKLISDRYGSQPMFYALADGLVFASQAIAVLQSPGVSPDLDLQALFEFMAFQQVFGTRTLTKSIAIVPPASILTFDGECSIERYWDRRYQPVEAGEEEFAEEMAAIFSRTMSRVGGENPAIMLSGGLDSRMAFAACESPPHCLTMGDYATSEYWLAAKIAQVRGVDTELLQRDPDHYVRLVDTAVRIGSGMYMFCHAHQLGLLEDRDCDVMLHGFAPEVFFRGTYVAKKWLRVGRLRVAKTQIPLSDAAFPGVVKEKMKHSLMSRNPSQVFSLDLAGKFADTIDESIDCCRRAAAEESDDLQEQFLWFNTGHHTKFPSFLFQLAFRPYMREGGLLFDNDVLDLCLKMPVSARVNNSIWLKALARLNRDIASISDANTGWHPQMPLVATKVLNAPKRLLRPAKRARSEWENYKSDESWPDFAKVLRYNGRMRDMLASAIDDLDPGLFNVGRLKGMFDEHMAGRDNWTRFLCLALTFARWRSASTTTATEIPQRLQPCADQQSAPGLAHAQGDTRPGEPRGRLGRGK
jgi:hypothetical protein